ALLRLAILGLALALGALAAVLAGLHRLEFLGADRAVGVGVEGLDLLAETLALDGGDLGGREGAVLVGVVALHRRRPVLGLGFGRRGILGEDRGHDGGGEQKGADRTHGVILSGNPPGIGVRRGSSTRV